MKFFLSLVGKNFHSNRESQFRSNEANVRWWMWIVFSELLEPQKKAEMQRGAKDDTLRRVLMCTNVYARVWNCEWIEIELNWQLSSGIFRSNSGSSWIHWICRLSQLFNLPVIAQRQSSVINNLHQHHNFWAEISRQPPTLKSAQTHWTRLHKYLIGCSISRIDAQRLFADNWNIFLAMRDCVLFMFDCWRWFRCCLLWDARLLTSTLSLLYV